MLNKTEVKSKEPIWKKWWFWEIIAVFVIIIILVNRGEKKEIKSEQQLPQKQAQSQETLPSPQEEQKEQEIQEKPQIKIVFDIPSLIKTNISEVKTMLGKPVSEYNLSGITTATYRKDGYELQIDYLSLTGEVAEIFLAKNINSRDVLLNAGNLDENSSLYSVKLQSSLRPDIARYTGVHIYRWK